MFPYPVSWLRHRRVVKCVKQESFLRSWESARRSQLCSQEPNIGLYTMLAECSPHLTPHRLKSILMFLLSQPIHPASCSSRIFQQKIWTQFLRLLCVLKVSTISLVVPNNLYTAFFYGKGLVQPISQAGASSVIGYHIQFIQYIHRNRRTLHTMTARDQLTWLSEHFESCNEPESLK